MTGKELIELMTMFRETIDKGLDKAEAAIEKLSSKEAVHSVEEARARDFVNETKKRYPKITDNPPVEESANADDTADPQIGFKCTSIDDIVKGVSYYTGIHTDELTEQVKEFIDSISACKNERCEECECEECNDERTCTEDDIATKMREETHRKYLDLCKRFPIFKYMTTVGAGTINDAYSFFTNNKVTSDPIMSCGNRDVLRKTILSTTTPDIELCMCLDLNEVFTSKYLNDLRDSTEGYKGIRVNLTVNSKYELTGEFAEYYPDILSCYFTTINAIFPTEKKVITPFKFDTIASEVNKCDTYWNYNSSCAIDTRVNEISCGDLAAYMSSIGMILELFVRVFMMTKRTLDAEIAKHYRNANKSRMNEQLLPAFNKLAGKFDVLKDIINMPEKRQSRIVTLFKQYNVEETRGPQYTSYALFGATPSGTNVSMITNCPGRTLWSVLSNSGHVEFTIDIEVERSKYTSTKALEVCTNEVLKLTSIKSLGKKAIVDFTGGFTAKDDGGVYGHIDVNIGIRDHNDECIADAIDACKQMIALTFINTLHIIKLHEFTEEDLDFKK